jgi:CubicO group peptidase (beta-lactamase class C family)
MTIEKKLRGLLVAALVSGVGSVSAISADHSNAKAPEATAEQAKGSFWDMPLLEKAYIDTNPADRKDGIKVGRLSVNDGNKNALVKLAKELDDGKDGGYDSLLIAYKGKLQLEAYYDRARVNLPHPQASATKGYTTLILGRAMQLGYLTMADLDKPLIDFLGGLDRSKLVEGADKITLHKAMTMRSGIRVSEEKRRELEENSDAVKGEGLVQALLETTPPITEESQSYLYSFDPDLVMQVIEAVVPGSAQDFIKSELLDKMGITNFTWLDDVTGLPEAGWRVSMTSRDMIKWGLLVANGGKWNGEQLIPSDYIKKATSPLVNPGAEWQPDNYRYGYYWYHVPVAVGDKTYDTTFAWGGWGQYVVVVPELDLTVTLTGDASEDKIMEKVSDTIIPAFAE